MDFANSIGSALRIAIILIIAIFVLLPLAFWVVRSFNVFVGLRQQTSDAWANIDAELKRRHDLVPNLVAAVQGYATHEQQVFERVASARDTALRNGDDVAKRAQSEVAFSSAIKQLYAVAENYPALKANQAYLELQAQLEDTENRIEAARQTYNAAVQQYNQAIRMFPAMLVATIFGFRAAAYFAATEDDKTAPVVAAP